MKAKTPTLNVLLKLILSRFFKPNKCRNCLNKNRKYFESSNELATIYNQEKELRLQDKLGKENLHEDQKEVFEPNIGTIKDMSEDVTKTMMATSEENNKTLADSQSHAGAEIANLNGKLLETMIVLGILESCLLSLLSKITNHEYATQFKLVKDHQSNRVIDLLRKTIPVTLGDNLFKFGDTGKKFELNGDLLKLITTRTIIVNLADVLDKKIQVDCTK